MRYRALINAMVSNYSDPADIAWQREQVIINNNISGLTRCPQAEHFAAQLETRVLRIDDRRKAIAEYSRKNDEERSGQSDSSTLKILEAR